MLSLTIEKKFFQAGYKIIGGIDEAGRGPLAGPVVAACLACKTARLPDNKKYKEVKNSNKLTEKKREELYNFLKNDQGFSIGVGVCDHITIDRVNILQATFLAMKMAVSSLKSKPDFLLIDGQHKIPNLTTEQRAIINGDDFVFLIAAASIIAKVERDRIMRSLHKKFPEYNFFRHKGYGTKEHILQLQKFGPCPIHRKTFAPVSKLVAR
ncbi:MAG: ribonuclease HII [Candidatus Falkowbacteria bacterium]|nr:ribonuclease HII [Candidatus Falkowbacteria bacterium]